MTGFGRFPDGPRQYRFGNVVLDIPARKILVAGDVIPLEPKSFDVLKLLFENRGRVVGKEEIIAAIWHGAFVTDNSLTRAVTKVRKALGDDSKEPRYIETIPTIGYRFTAECVALDANAAASKSSREGFESIAILPFVSHEADREMEYLAEGLTGGAIRLLSEIPGLKVIPRSTVYRFKHAEEDAASFARSLAVEVVLSGALRREADRLVLEIELIHVGQDAIILDRRYFADPSEWMDLQAELTLDIARGLGLDVNRGQSARLRRHPTISPAAFRAFLRGDFAVRRLSPPSLHEAIQAFQEALSLDDKFALAWTQKAHAHVVLGLYFEEAEKHLPVAKEAARRALELDPSLQAAHACLGIVHLVYDWDYAAAETELASVASCRHAILAFGCTGHLLAQSGRALHAEGQMRNMLAFDPRNPTLVIELGCNDYYRRRYETGLDHFRAAAELDPESPVPIWGIGRCFNQMKQYDEALQTLRSFKARMGFEPPIVTSEIGYGLALAGRLEEALAIAEELRRAAETHFVDPYFTSLIHLGLCDYASTFEWLEKAYRIKSTFMVSIAGDPKWDSVRGDSRFHGILQKIAFQPR